MTRAEALKALLALPDPKDLPARGHRVIHAEADRRKLSLNYTFKVLTSVLRRQA